ncbi:hypothetical protein OH492_12940 [Vibrio chagasii]|nr:hypothetical protein [Vibrio chagasii]
MTNFSNFSAFYLRHPHLVSASVSAEDNQPQVDPVSFSSMQKITEKNSDIERISANFQSILHREPKTTTNTNSKLLREGEELKANQ